MTGIDNEDIEILKEQVEILGLKPVDAMNRFNITPTPEVIKQLVLEGFDLSEMYKAYNFYFYLDTKEKGIATAIRSRINEIYGNDVFTLLSLAYYYKKKTASYDKKDKVAISTALPSYYFYIHKGIGMHRCGSIKEIEEFELSGEHERIRKELGISNNGNG